MAYKNFTNCTEEQYYEIIYSQDDTNRIKILFNNVELADADEYCEKLTVKNRILPDDGSKRFSLGNFVSKEAELILRDLPSTTTIQDQVSISIGTLVNESNDTYEYVPIGIFNIQDTPVTDQNKVTIKLRDNRVKFDYYYNAKPLIDEKGGKANYYQILDDICTQAGVINKVGHFAGDDIEVSIYDNTITATSYVAKIAEQCGMIPVINRLGELEFINPKSDKATTQIESTATLQNVGSTQIDNIELIGNTTQEGTPTPSSPQEVKTVTGLQEIKAVGKNLLNLNRTLGTPSNTASANTTKRTFNYNQYVLGISANNYYYPTYIANATIENDKITIKNTNGAYGIGLPLKVETNTTYKLNYSTSASANQNVGVGYYSSDGTFISYLVSTGANNYLDITTPDNCDFMVIIFKPTANTEITYSNIQLEKGSTATTYEPYQEQVSEINLGNIELCKIGTYEDKIFKTTGKNLFDKDVGFVNGYIDNSGNFNSNDTIVLFNGYISAKESTTYTFSFNKNVSNSSIVAYNENKVFISRHIVNSSKQNSWELPQNTKYIRLQFNYNNTSNSITQDLINTLEMQLELGNSITDYEPYSNNEWYVKKAIGKVVLNGSENWTSHSSTSGTNYRYWLLTGFSSVFDNIIQASESNIMGKVLCNNFNQALFSNTSYGKFSINTTSGNQWILFNVDGSDITTLANFKTWLSTHNTIVYYPLASPTYEKLNDTLQEELNSIRLLEGTNNIMSSVPIELEYYVEKTPIRIPLSIIEKYEVGEPYTIERVVYESGVIKYETSDDDTLSTLYLDASNEYIESQEQVDYIKDMLNGFTIDSVNTGRVLGNPAIDAYDLIEVYDDDDDNEPTIFKTFANNTYTYTGINRNTFDTQIGIEERTENVSISGEANFQKWAKSSINNLEGSIELNAGEIDDLDNRLKETKLIVDTDSARIDTVEESFNEDGSVKALKTTNYTFDADGLRIGKSTDDYNSLQDNTGTYYYEKDTMTGKYTKDGSVQKDLALFGTYYYGIDEENFNVATFTRDDALFIAQLYEKTYTDKNGNQVTKNAVGHFYNGR